jgi:toxin ParE1/3/4
MPRVVISFAVSALRDLEEVKVWVAGQGVSDIGERLVTEVFQRVETLVDYPDIGRVVPEFGQSFLRELIHAPFRIVYRHDTKRVRIVRVWRSERLLHLDPDSKASWTGDDSHD